MLKKRLIGVITVKDGWAVQSFAYRRYLPLGRPERLAENLDRWGADEILVLCIDRSSKGIGPDLALLKRLAEMGLSTPVTYGGGIRTAVDAAAVIQSGAERFCVDAALSGDRHLIREMAALLGAQAVIASLPLVVGGREPRRYDYRSRQLVALNDEDSALFCEGVISEALVIDPHHEGKPNSFDMDLVHRFPFPDVPLIVFGGISEPDQIGALLANPRVAAVAVGNFLSYSEHAVQRLKRRLTDHALRPPIFATND